MNRLLPLVAAVILCAAALQAQTMVRVTETAGIDRKDEPVIVEINGRERVLFATIRADQTRDLPLGELVDEGELIVRRVNDVGFRLENEVLVADHSIRTTAAGAEDSGALRALRFRPRDVTLLRTQNRMHWAPSFQRAGADHYSSIATWTPVQETHMSRGAGWFRHRRTGTHQEYPEIELDAEYFYFAHVPYFLFEATMKVVEPIEMYFLRGQEMTMDDFFTHVVFPGRDGKPQMLTFDERTAVLEAKPIPVDAPWVAFVNPEKGYGFGAVVLAYEATTTAGAFTSINDGAQNGKYWDRRLISEKVTSLKPGDRYYEKTAFVLFRSSKADPYGEFFDWEKRIRNPVRIEVLD